jgi:hypothetical protein
MPLCGYFLNLTINNESTGLDHFFHPLGINGFFTQVRTLISALSALFDSEAKP